MLDRGARLEIVMTDPSTPENTRVRVTVLGEGMLSASSTGAGFHAEVDPVTRRQRLVGGIDRHDLWAERTHTGSHLVDGLPHGQALEALIVVGGRFYELELSPPQLAAGEHRVVKWELPDGTEIRGQVVDRLGVGIPGCVVCLSRDDGSAAGGYLGPRSGIFQTQRVAADGSFAFERVPEGDWLVAVCPSPEIASSMESVSLMPGIPSEPIRLVTDRGLFVRGRIEGFLGQRIPTTYQVLLSRDLEPQEPTQETARGRGGLIDRMSGDFWIGPVTRETHSLYLVGPLGIEDVVLVAGGSDSVVLRVHAQSEFESIR